MEKPKGFVQFKENWKYTYSWVKYSWELKDHKDAETGIITKIWQEILYCESC